MAEDVEAWIRRARQFEKNGVERMISELDDCVRSESDPTVLPALLQLLEWSVDAWREALRVCKSCFKLLLLLFLHMDLTTRSVTCLLRFDAVVCVCVC